MQNSAKPARAFIIDTGSVNFSPKSRAANSRTFLGHCIGLMALSNISGHGPDGGLGAGGCVTSGLGASDLPDPGRTDVCMDWLHNSDQSYTQSYTTGAHT